MTVPRLVSARVSRISGSPSLHWTKQKVGKKTCARNHVQDLIPPSRLGRGRCGRTPLPCTGSRLSLCAGLAAAEPDSVVDCRLAAEEIWVVQFPPAGFKFLLSKGVIFVSVVRGGQEIGVSGLGNFLVYFILIGFKYERVPRKVIEGWIYSKVSQYFDEGCDSWKEA